ncbi:hypothetical protein [Streptomyces sp. NPDC048639]|uniref:hypothetical protein n=1 Tax=Streptomyces sp. NPDC048639 TaxID=3365581 RepID=UPI003711D8E6
MKLRAETKAEEKESRVDLSMAQVAGSAIAAVVAALLAGKLGVYGTVLGAGVVSVVASTGGTLFQHFFRRTGEQIRDVTEQAKPKGRQVPVADPGYVDRTDRTGGHTGGHTGGSADSTADPTMALPRLGAPLTGEADEDRTRLLEQIETTRMMPRVDAAADVTHDSSSFDATTMLPQVRGGTSSTGTTEPVSLEHGPAGRSPAGSAPEAYTEGTTHGSRLRGWRRSLLAALAVFVLAMGTITVIELLTGSTASGTGGTTVGRIVGNDSGNDTDGGDDGQQPDTPAPSPSGGQQSGRDSGGAGDDHRSPDPSRSNSGDPDAPSKPDEDSGDSTGPTGEPSPSGSGSSSSSGTGDSSGGNSGTSEGNSGQGGKDDDGDKPGPRTGNDPQNGSDGGDGSGP